MPTATFDASRFIVRARRRADLSQRELASELEVSQSAVARMEQNLRMVRVHDLSRILELAGLRLAVLDQNGAEVRPVPSDAVRDNARRRFPAHLDVLPPDQVPKHRLFFPRYDRLPATAWFHHRPMRDELRRATPTSPLPDHPTEGELAHRRQLLLTSRLRVRPRGPVHAEGQGPVNAKGKGPVNAKGKGPVEAFDPGPFRTFDPG